MNVRDFISYRMEKTASKRHIAMDMGKDTLLAMVGKKGKTKRAIEASKNEIQAAKDHFSGMMGLLESPMGKRIDTLRDRKPGFTRKALMTKLKRR